jgi:hypothetical protein
MGEVRWPRSAATAQAAALPVPSKRTKVFHIVDLDILSGHPSPQVSIRSLDDSFLLSLSLFPVIVLLI